MRVMYDQNGRSIKLGKIIAKGGEGEIYSLPNFRDCCAKVYFKDKMSFYLESKLNAMILNSPEDKVKDAFKSPSIAWPQKKLYYDTNNDKLGGYVMELLDVTRYKSSHLYFDEMDRLNTLGGSFTWKHLMYAARNIASIVTSVHKAKHRIGDLSDNNILIAPDTLVALVDCDSFQIFNQESGKYFPCTVHIPEYSPPELLNSNIDLKAYDRYYSDLFALGVIIFRLLMGGYHPYAGVGGPVSKANSRQEKIILGFYPYGNYYSAVQPPEGAWPYEIIPPELRKLFEQCFIEGHSNPQKRPNASDWYSVLRGCTE